MNIKKISNTRFDYLKLVSNKGKNLTVKQLFRLIKGEIQNILGMKMNYRKLSKDFLTFNNKNGGNKWYINDRILDSLRFADYVLPTAELNRISKNLIEKFKEKGAYFEFIVELYKKFNPQSRGGFSRHPDMLVDYFKNINSLEIAYWLGFLLAEAHLRVTGNTRTLMMPLSAEDAILMKNFCQAIGFDYRKLKYVRSVGEQGQTLRKLFLSFSDKIFGDNLIEAGFPKNKKSSIVRFPYWLYSDKRFVMAMLLGFFDGDGSHGAKNPNFADKGLSPMFKLKNRQFLQDIKDYFMIKNDIVPVGKGYYQLFIGKDLFNELLVNYKDSLERKRHIYDDPNTRRKNQMKGLDVLAKDGEEKFRFSKTELKKYYDRGLSSLKIAARHYIKHGIKINPETVHYWGNKRGLKKASGVLVERKISIELLKKGWSLERIYEKEFELTYRSDAQSRYNLKKKFITIFSNDPKVSGSQDILRKIVEVYGEIDNNPLVLTEKELVILKRKDGWSLQRIYVEALGYKYASTSKSDYWRMIKKYGDIFDNDVSIHRTSEYDKTILEQIERVYNPASKL